jgi:hypothetical protein
MDSLDTLLEMRSGKAQFTRNGRNETRFSCGRPLSAGIREHLRELERLFHETLADFTGLNPIINGHILVRERWVNQKSHILKFGVFWGTIQAKGLWNISFGGTLDGLRKFRRGPWEQWPMDLPRCARFGARYPLVFSPYCATLMHEAVGHALEDDYLHNSPLTPKIGTRFCHEEITLTDQPEIPGLAGSMKWDATGQPASETLLIHRGCFVGDLDKEKGVWRRGSYKANPLIRTSNAVLKPGTANPGDWLRFLPDLYYIPWIEKGQWMPGTQNIEFRTGPVFRIHKGEPTSCFPGLTLTCQTLSFLKSIQAVGRDVCLDPLVHWCFKKNQGVPMSLLSPSLLVENCFTQTGGIKS